MKNVVITAIALLFINSCKSKNAVVDVDTLPKDISLKPENNISQQLEQEQLKMVMLEIDSLIQTVNCPNPEEWTFTAIGAKPCGGPSSYIAYPKKLAEEILPKVNKLTAMQDAFNKKYRLMSDCAIVLPPTEIACVEGKAVLMNENSAALTVQ
ncbi:hypothetical protein [Chryseobacterium sp. MP_3.2]|uniref:hypothetical protein n=1 Tax=Chryseobacterium sp. MP_3.2 TaxID=3071712 RepID=UPI002E07E698|nr:hypothetical protein [Chryseobacterium sp. MP_3.2]